MKPCFTLILAQASCVDSVPLSSFTNMEPRYCWEKWWEKMVKNIFKNTGLKRAATLKCCTQRLKCIYIWTQGARVRSEELLTYVLIYANISAHDFDRDTESFKANPLMLTCLIVIYKWNILRLVLGSNIPQLTVDVKGFDLMENTSF